MYSKELQEIQESFKEVIGGYSVSFVEDKDSPANQQLKLLQEENVMLKSEIITLKGLVDRSTKENLRLVGEMKEPPQTQVITENEMKDHMLNVGELRQNMDAIAHQISLLPAIEQSINT